MRQYEYMSTKGEHFTLVSDRLGWMGYSRDRSDRLTGYYQTRDQVEAAIDDEHFQALTEGEQDNEW